MSHRTSSGPWAEGEEPAPDCYRVEWQEDTAIVRHYQDKKTGRPCCKVSVAITDRDRAQSFDFELRPGASAALHRAMSAIEKKHQHA